MDPLMVHPTVREFVKMLMNNFDASAPFHVRVANDLFHIDAMEVKKDPDGTAVLELRLG